MVFLFLKSIYVRLRKTTLLRIVYCHFLASCISRLVFRPWVQSNIAQKKRLLVNSPAPFSSKLCMFFLLFLPFSRPFLTFFNSFFHPFVLFPPFAYISRLFASFAILYPSLTLLFFSIPLLPF